ncbi:MAG: hypothetical protein N2512_00980, partial [Armatimonadetes bacterium]|nr:hypothetical protein [Armatimonadota bacterium]
MWQTVVSAAGKVSVALGGWLLLSALVHAGAVTAAIPNLRFRRSMIVGLLVVPSVAAVFFLAGALYGNASLEEAAGVLAAVPVAGANLVVLKLVYRTTWTKALVALLATALYVFLAGAT